MAERGFPLPGSSYREVTRMIQGYGTVGDNAVPGDVARVISSHETAISRNSKFLLAIGVIQGGKKKSITALGAQLAHALQHDMNDEIVTKWREVVEATDFLQKVLAAVRIRKGMDESSLQSHVAYSAGQPKTPGVMTGAGTIVEILKAAELLREEGGNLVAVAAEATARDDEQPPSANPIQKKFKQVFRVPQVTTALGEVGLTIDVRIQCTADDLDVLGPKLKNLIKQLGESEENDDSTADTGDLHEE